MGQPRIFMLCLLLMAVLAPFSPQAQTVWIIRHAEKDTTNPSDTDPALSLTGQERAKDLADLLKAKRVVAVHSTPFKRTKQTVELTANSHGLTVQTYNPADALSLVSTVLKQIKDGSVVIVGHSNTVLELVEALGAKRPIPALGEDDYDYVFAVTVEGNSIKLQTLQYGKPHRAGNQK